MSRRVRRPEARARARGGAPLGRADGASADVTAVAASLPRRFASLVKLEHTVFALPFAYVGAFLAWNGVPRGRDLLWITVAMVGARTVAMALNRLIDAELDARNPRTAGRELPAGALSRAQVVALCAVALAVFLVAVFQLDPLVRWLWPVPVALFVVYPYLKRFTWLCHAWLGAALGLAPVGAWAAGFGEGGAFVGSRLHHAGTVVLLAAVGLGLEVGLFYWVGVAAVASLLAYEHSLVRPGDLRRLDAAFFTVNGVISIVFFGLVA